MNQLESEFATIEATIREGGGAKGIERQKHLGRLTARERIANLIDPDSHPFELNLWAAYGMYEEWGGLPAAGVITTIASVEKRQCMIIANDATVKAGAFFPQTVKKVLRAQRIAYECRLPILYLVDSSGVFLPLQDEIFPDEDDFGRIFRNNAVISATGIPQFAAIMGNCIAGGGYLPVLCDTVLMTEGSGLYLAGPALVKAAIGQNVGTEELGGAKMHAQISGTVDFYEKDDLSCLKRLRSLIQMLPEDPWIAPSSKGIEITGNSHEMLQAIIDPHTLQEYKADYGRTVITAFASILGIPVGIVMNQKNSVSTAQGEIEIGSVLYTESADKTARFIMECNQIKVPLIFLQDVSGFMVGKQAEQAGIIKSGAKVVNAISNSIVPKITVLIGKSFGAGHYALCGKAYDPNFILAWPNASYAVMGSDQAADTLFSVQEQAAKRKGTNFDAEEAKKMHEELKKSYERQTDIRYAAARGWVDAIIKPSQTRNILGSLLQLVKRAPVSSKTFHTGVIQT